ncbi:hypothetical protein G6O69_08030 [Pseudenhygromyxa sp. WMMC2535]|uniref:hypothetical protein n=1 Tax=Pseudenhygromyxa sp. WMMC2535 TaxID=2712867 RepID=UPI0015541E1A|nr:hypothetical protein [Pseudenhygromyxa sp. WMMC2535]NVB37778.1 hypothetical protein [Pseudenhygromyxa sp. WMMC2535]
MATRKLWTWSIVGSALFHVGMVVVLSLLPEGPRSGGAPKRDLLFTPGAVIPIEIDVDAPLAALEPSVQPTPTPDDFSERPALAPDDSTPTPTPTPTAGTQPPQAPTEASPSESPSAPGLLAGMRDTSRTSATAGERGGSGVIVDPSLLGGSRRAYEEGLANPGVGKGAVQGPAPPPSGSADLSFTKEGDKMVYRDPGGRFVAYLKNDGRVDFRNKAAKGSWSQIGIGDPGGMLSKAAGEDPYARAKYTLLKATFEMRLGMAVNFQKRQLKKRLRRLEKDLDKLWADERRDLPARRELLFQRWDECIEPDDAEQEAAALPGFADSNAAELDEARRDAAGEARETIIGFIRENAPKGSPQAYTASELADMNRRRASTAKFSPY